MQCRDVDRLVTAYVDADLDDHRSSALRGHLRVCERCAARVDDEVRVRDAGGDLPVMDPPPELWRAIDARLASEEISDGERPRLALWWRRVIDGARRQTIPLTVGAALAGGLLVVRLAGSSGDSSPASEVAQELAASGAPSPGGDTPAGCSARATRDEELRCQVEASDRRYVDAIAELDAALAEERAAWSADDAARFDAEVGALDLAAGQELERLAVQENTSPADRDPLHAIYQQKIDLVSAAVVTGRPGEDW